MKKKWRVFACCSCPLKYNSSDGWRCRFYDKNFNIVEMNEKPKFCKVNEVNAVELDIKKK